MAYKNDNFGDQGGCDSAVPHCLATNGNDRMRVPRLISIKVKDKMKTDNPRSSYWVCSADVGAIKQCTRRPSVQVCPINVGQGDSILLKLQYEQGMLHTYIQGTDSIEKACST
jgi:hypothetical protein